MTGAAGDGPSDLAARVAALYAGPLDRFISARNSASTEAKRAGDKDLAAELRALPKPSSAAWLVNVLVQRRRAEVEQVIELGVSLKEAQSGMDRAQLQALGQQRQRLLAAVARESLAAASEAGYDVGAAALPGVEQTLRAALADPAAAAAVVSGRLVRTLEASGWDAVDLEGAVAGPFDPPGSGLGPATSSDGTGVGRTSEDSAGAPAQASSGDGAKAGGGAAAGAMARAAARATRRRKQAEAAFAAARASRVAAEAVAAEARLNVEQAGLRHAELASSIEELEKQLGTRRRELTRGASALATLTERAEEAAEELIDARADEEAARTNLEVEGLGK